MQCWNSSYLQQPQLGSGPTFLLSVPDYYELMYLVMNHGQLMYLVPNFSNQENEDKACCLDVVTNQQAIISNSFTKMMVLKYWWWIIQISRCSI